MRLDRLGKLSTAQDLTSDSTTDSENVIEVQALDYGHPTDVWWVVDCETVATGESDDTFQFQLMLSKESTLDTNVEVLSRTVTGYASACLATAGKHIIAVKVGKMLKDLLSTDGSDYEFIGMISTISAGATVSINASLSNSEPGTEYQTQVVDSNVTVPDHASAGS